MAKFEEYYLYNQKINVTTEEFVSNNILKSFGIDIEKAVASVGEIRHWKDGEYKKVSEGKWVKIVKNKEKQLSNIAAVKKINSEIQDLKNQILNQRRIFEQNTKNPHEYGTFMYNMFFQREWNEERKRNNFINQIAQKIKDLQDELIEIQKITYIEKKQQREKEVGKHEIDDVEIDEIIDNFKSIFSTIEKNTPKNMKAIELMPEVTINDYYLDTETIFSLILNASDWRKIQKTWNDMKNSNKYIYKESPKSASEYLIDETTGDIYRYSDHWGKVASCVWNLDVNNKDNDSGFIIAKSNIKDFHRREDSYTIYLNPEYSVNILKATEDIFPHLKRLVQENNEFYLAKGVERKIVNFSKEIFKKYINTSIFMVEEITKLKEKYSLF